MTDIIKSYVDKARLERYDNKIKAYISEEDAKSYKTILLSTNGKVLYFYKKENATLQDTADFFIDLGALISECYTPSFSGSTLVFSLSTEYYVPSFSGNALVFSIQSN